MGQNPKRIANMHERKKSAKMSNKELGEEYGMSGQHAGRLLRKHVKGCSDE